jgi:hypothetical protein
MKKLNNAAALELKPAEILRDSGKGARPGLYAIGRVSHGGLTQTNESPVFPGRFILDAYRSLLEPV